MRYLSFLFILFITSHALADDVADTQRFIDSLISTPSPTSPLGKSSRPLSSDSKAWVDSLRAQQSSIEQFRPTPQAIYFVSFSMPEDGLKRFIFQSYSLGIPVSLRGMVNNDMRQTANAVLKLVSDEKMGGVQIDPNSFKKYGILSVPALVVTCANTYDRISGNLDLREALTKISLSGDCADTAKKILSSHP